LIFALPKYKNLVVDHPPAGVPGRREGAGKAVGASGYRKQLWMLH